MFFSPKGSSRYSTATIALFTANAQVSTSNESFTLHSLEPAEGANAKLVPRLEHKFHEKKKTVRTVASGSLPWTNRLNWDNTTEIHLCFCHLFVNLKGDRY